MNLKSASLLSKLIKQFKEAHGGALPDRIVVEPVALVALGIKKSVAPVWQGLKVECREIDRKEVVKPGQGTRLGVLLDTKGSQVVACDLIA
jgi:hypothetical protein